MIYTALLNISSTVKQGEIMTEIENWSIYRGKQILEAQDDERMRCIPYRVEYNWLTGSVEGSILLQQIYYWWIKKERKPFYKFRKPCHHPFYRAGDSWTEELGFTTYKFDKALKTIATKITKGTSKTEAFKKSPIIYWTDKDRLTWYQVNESLLSRLINCVYNRQDRIRKLDLPSYINTEELLNNLEKMEEHIYILTESTS